MLLKKNKSLNPEEIPGKLKVIASHQKLLLNMLNKCLLRGSLTIATKTYYNYI